MGNPPKILFLILLNSALLTSCLKGLDPLPSNISDLSMSLSVPVGKADIPLSNTYSIGLPNYWLDLDFVPPWARFEEIYYTDSVAVDLSKVYEKSSSISFLSIKVVIWNEYPAAATASLSFVDASYSTLYDFNDIQINRSHILFNGDIVNPGFSSETFSFDQTQIENLRTSQFLVFHIKIYLKQADPYSFKYWDSFKLTCQVGARVDFVLNNL